MNPSTGVYTAGTTSGVTDAVEVADSFGNVAEAHVAVEPPFVFTPAAPQTVVGGSIRLSVEGGTGSGSVWSFAPGGDLSGGTISAAGDYVAGVTPNVVDTVQVVDSAGLSATVTIQVDPAIVITPATAAVVEGSLQSFSASGGSGVGYTWGFANGGDHSGGTMTSGGVYTAGTTTGTDTIQVADSAGSTATARITVELPLAITPATAAVVAGGSLTFGTSGGSGSGQTWAISPDFSGGTITSAGVYTAGFLPGTDTVIVTDSGRNTAQATVLVVAPLSVSPASPVSVTPLQAVAFTTSGGLAPFQWAVSPNGSEATVDAGAYVAGPIGNSTDVVTVTDALGESASVTIDVGPGVTISPPTSTVLPGVMLSFSASGGTGQGFSWSFASGGDESMGSIDALTGTYVAGSATGVTDTIQATDSLGNMATATVAVDPTFVFTPAAPRVAAGTSLQLSVTGGTGAGYAWSFATGGDVSGGTISASGLYVAGPTIGAIDTVEVVDSAGLSAQLQITVTALPLTVTPSSPVLVAPLQTVTFVASGGEEPYGWTLTTDASGATVTAAGVYTAGATPDVQDDVTVTDSLTDTAYITINVGPGVTVTPSTATVVAGGAASFSASGGAGSGYQWSFSQHGDNSGGRIDPNTGDYVAGTTANVTDAIQATDPLGNVGTASITVTSPAHRVAGPADAGAPDSGVIVPDAGSSADAGSRDAGEPDAGVQQDAGSPDAGSGDLDAGLSADAGEAVADAGPVDAGSPVVDAGEGDAGQTSFTDAGSPDAAAADAGVQVIVDAGGADAGPVDAGSPSIDAGSPDSGTEESDAGLSDAGLPDAGGAPDAGEGGPQDGGPADAGELGSDAGLPVGDAGMVADAGSVADAGLLQNQDAGAASPSHGGCGCGGGDSTTGSLLILAVTRLATAAQRRRARRLLA